MKKIVAVCALSLFSMVAGANELLLTSSSSKAGATQVSIDFVSDGQAVAFQYNIALPKGVSADQVDLRSCSADLPKQYVGECSVAKGQIIGFVVNDANVPFPAGVLPVGKIGIASAAKLRNLEVLKLEVVGSNAKTLKASVSVDPVK